MEQAESSESWEYEEVAEMVDVVGEPAKEQSVQTTGGSKVNVACQAVAEELRSCAKVPKRNQKSQTVTEGMDACGSDAAVNAAVSPSEGILRLVISDFKNVTDTVCGPTMEINSLMWRIKAIPKEQVVRKRVEKSLGFYVQCCADGYSENWSCQAAAELTLISQNPGTPNFSKRTNHIYTSKENDWGYSCFMPWAEVIDESQGYFKDGAVILEAVVKAQPPKNILTPAQFRRKVEDYLRLANVQCSRGLLDKAIEVNESALKICKDSDRDLKEALMNQKKELIEKKLKQRIESIEKGPVVEDDCGSTCKQQSLKQAIAGLPKVGKQAAVKLRGHAGVKTEESLIIEKADLDTTSKLQKSNTSVFEKCAKNHTEELSCATSITASSCAHMPVPVPMFCSRHRSHTFSFDSPFSGFHVTGDQPSDTDR